MGLDDHQVGIAVGGFSLGRSLFAFIPAKRSTVAAACRPSPSASTRPSGYLLGGAGIGIGYGLAFPVMATIITASISAASRGTASGFYTTAVFLAAGCYITPF